MPRAGRTAAGSPVRMLNTCFNCVDRHVLAGRGEQAALIWDSPMTGRIETFTYRQMQTRTAKLAGALAALGVTRGDRVVIYLPMVPEAAIAMLACARLGAIHSVVFGGFAAAELASRIADAKPKVIVSASCGLEPGRVVKYKPLLDAAIALSPHKPDACLILQREAERAELVAGPRPRSGGGRGGGGAARSGRRWRPPIRSTSSTPPARRDGRRAWCATMAAMRSRCGTRCGCSTASMPATCIGRPPTSAGWSATPTSSTRRCCAAAPA